ncbi:MAG: hypothetical protein LBL47_04460, partial [Lactobacillus sp.]|nr:hypothetical protein [Lactobacillus sp.]
MTKRLLYTSILAGLLISSNAYSVTIQNQNANLSVETDYSGNSSGAGMRATNKNGGAPWEVVTFADINVYDNSEGIYIGPNAAGRVVGVSGTETLYIHDNDGGISVDSGGELSIENMNVYLEANTSMAIGTGLGYVNIIGNTDGSNKLTIDATGSNDSAIINAGFITIENMDIDITGYDAGFTRLVYSSWQNSPGGGSEVLNISGSLNAENWLRIYDNNSSGGLNLIDNSANSEIKNINIEMSGNTATSSLYGYQSTSTNSRVYADQGYSKVFKFVDNEARSMDAIYHYGGIIRFHNYDIIIDGNTATDMINGLSAHTASQGSQFTADDGTARLIQISNNTVTNGNFDGLNDTNLIFTNMDILIDNNISKITTGLVLANATFTGDATNRNKIIITDNKSNSGGNVFGASIINTNNTISNMDIYAKNNDFMRLSSGDVTFDNSPILIDDNTSAAFTALPLYSFGTTDVYLNNGSNVVTNGGALWEVEGRA